MSRFLLVFCCLFFFSSLVISGAEENDAVSVEFAVVLLSEAEEDEQESALELWYPVATEKLEKFSAPVERASDIMTYSGPPTLKFYMGEEKAEKQFVGAVKVEPSKEPLMLLFFPHKQGKYKIYPMPVVSDMNNPGRALMLNLSSKDMAVKLNNQAGIVKPGKWMIEDLTEVKNYKLRMSFALRNETVKSGWEVIYSTYTGITPNSRVFLLLYPSLKNGEWMLKRIGLPQISTDSASS